MLAQQRHAMILDLLEQNGTVYTSDLVKRMNVSSETIRKDLDYLEQKERLVRVHGGAVPTAANQSANTKMLSDVPAEYTAFQIRNTQHMAEKAAITDYAASMIKEHQVIALDYGSTSQMMAMTLRKKFRFLTIITNSIQNALILAECPDFTIILTGGVLSKQEYTLVNDFTPILDHLHIDVLFLTASGIDPEVGITDMLLNEVKVQNQMRKAASQVIVLADSSKFGRSSLVKVCTLQDVDAILTDRNLSPDLEQKIRSTGSNLVLVPDLPTAES